eukprot:CAMPEP_0184685868 /NCGR_PEP_ID=MMETSP0312-20130426/20489_1 /TAXON_ID=31354 /ORGANISM="Compsopogon coeruleus, Strain SAG 36.94" /LENGTH=38 /DNA_ID= /DNA_START= /DNA_END= /DNA_ORIENTATION=
MRDEHATPEGGSGCVSVGNSGGENLRWNRRVARHGPLL